MTTYESNNDSHDDDSFSLGSTDSYQEDPLPPVSIKRSASTKSTGTRSSNRKTVSKQSSSVALGKRGNDNTDQVSEKSKRPGRKPLDKVPVSNRAAQRAFRERKEKFVSELQEKIDALEREKTESNEILLQENAQLKEQLKQLKEENYTLKETPFVFEFSSGLENSPIIETPQLQPQAPSEVFSLDPKDNTQYNTETGFYSTSPAVNYNTPYSDEIQSSSCSEEHSPKSNTLSREDDASTPIQQPIHNPLLFGNTSYHYDPQALLNAPKDNDIFYQGSDLFHGKDDFSYQDYRIPATDDYLIHGDSLPPLFGSTDVNFYDMSLGLYSTPNLQPFLADEYPDMTTKQQVQEQVCEKHNSVVVDALIRARGQYRTAYDIQEDIKATNPEFDINKLCDDLKRKASCREYDYPLSDKEVECYIACAKQNQAKSSLSS
ncbi:hypothetical protein CLU79DRAFT_303774 [Phycomyces nitens]|nr:hypothetical protein CLU79DRAFT_303774 [Phycomyces nitens]